MIRHGSFVHAVVRGPSCTHTHTQFRTHANYTSRVYICVTVMKCSGKSRTCLQRGGNLKVPYIYIHASPTRIFPGRDFRQSQSPLCVIILNDSSVFESIPSITHAMRSLFREMTQYIHTYISCAFAKNIFKAAFHDQNFKREEEGENF